MRHILVHMEYLSCQTAQCLWEFEHHDSHENSPLSH